MAEYKEIHGSNIEIVSSDPSNPVNGQVWYNTTSQTLKGITYNPAGAWASGGNVNTARRTGAGVGTQTAALISGGYAPGAVTANTEIYDGSSWTETGNLNTARRLYACGGTTTATIVGGGFTDARVAVAELWDGSSWTEVADLSTARNDSAVGGVFT